MKLATAVDAYIYVTIYIYICIYIYIIMNDARSSVALVVASGIGVGASIVLVAEPTCNCSFASSKPATSGRMG